MANCCEYYPCHSGLFQGFSCEFCYCPDYDDPNCSGNPKWIYLARGAKLKDCSDCLLPHTEEYRRKRNGKHA